MLDRWKHLREKLWANNEPEVTLIALTVPGILDPDGAEPYFDTFFDADGVRFYPQHIEPLVAQAASVSTGVKPKDYESLTRKLIDLGHHTPLEAIQFNFRVSGISKACGAQLSRHRIGQGHVSSSRRYQEQGAAFVYPILNYIEDADEARKAYCFYQDAYKEAYYLYLASRKMGAKKGDARYLVPTASVTERIWWINARALRDFLKLRLHANAEAEIQRLSSIILNLVTKITPTLFSDFSELLEEKICD